MTDPRDRPAAPSSVAPPARGLRIEQRMELLVGYVLLIGVLACLALVLAALLWQWTSTGSLDFDYALSGMNFFQLMSSEFGLAARGAASPRLLLTLGIVVLMLTPFVRVLVSMFYFLLALKDWKYTLFTAFVLAILTYSLFLR